jgi:hypothetical protein
MTDVSSAGGAPPAMAGPVNPAPPRANVWGTGRILAWILKVFAICYLSITSVVYAAPAVRVGISWARDNLPLIQTYVTTCCIAILCVNSLLGQAQLVERAARALRRLWPTHRYPTTDGEHGRDYVAPEAARNLPVTQPQRINTSQSTANRMPPPADLPPPPAHAPNPPMDLAT